MCVTSVAVEAPNSHAQHLRSNILMHHTGRRCQELGVPLVVVAHGAAGDALALDRAALDEARSAEAKTTTCKGSPLHHETSQPSSHGLDWKCALSTRHGC